MATKRPAGGVKSLAVKNDIGTEHMSAFVTFRNPAVTDNVLLREHLSAVHTYIPFRGSVKLDYVLASSHLMKSVDILCYHTR